MAKLKDLVQRAPVHPIKEYIRVTRTGDDTVETMDYLTKGVLNKLIPDNTLF